VGRADGLTRQIIRILYAREVVFLRDIHKKFG
jgi:hypothetical protein